MIYLIGGSERSGKTTLAQSMSMKTGAPVVFTDSLTPTVIAATQTSAVRSMWTPTRGLIEHAVLCNQDFIIVGRHFVPRDIKKLKGTKFWEHIKLVYLVKKKRSNVDWMYPTMFEWIFPPVKKDSEKYGNSAAKIEKYSKMILQEAKKYGFKVINTEDNFEKKLEEARTYLTSGV